MKNKWVINASPLIVLGKISLIKIIPLMCDELIIPEGVAKEISKGKIDDSARKWLANDGQKYIKNIGEIDLVIGAWDLGLGESEVLSYCYHHNNCSAIIDDLAARKCASTFSIKTKGTLSLILLGKNKGIIREVKPVLNQIVDTGFRIDQSLFDLMIRMSKE